MILDTVNKVIEVILGEAKTTNDCEYTADFVDTANGLSFVPGATSGLTNGVTLITAVAAPGANLQRQVKALTIYNSDTVGHNVTVRLYDGTNRRRFITVALAVGQSLVFTPEAGWSIVPSSVVAPVCLVYRSTTQTVTALTKIQFDTTLFDTAGYWDGTNFRYTPKTPGYYSVTGHADISATLTHAVDALIYYTSIQKNGAEIGRTILFSQAALSAAAVENILPAAALAACNGSTDYIEMWGASDTSTSTSILGGVYATFMAINFVRPL